MHRIIVLDTIADAGLDLLGQATDFEYEVRTGLKGEELRKALGEFDGAICRSGVKITADCLKGVPRLKAIVRAGVGVDNIDTQAAMMENIVVMNTPAGNTLSTAEHTFALMLAMCRHVAPAYEELKAGTWNRKHMGTQLSDKVLGVVGLGRIGREVAARGRAFGMTVLGFDPFISAEFAQELGIVKVETVAEMLPRVDFLTVHTPLTEQTRYLVGMKELAVLKPGVRLVNCARGGIYEEAAIVEGLKSGVIAGAALDVFENEPCTKSPLFGLKGVVCTPHLGASTEEAQASVAVEGVDLLIRYLRTGEARHAVNMILTDPKNLEEVRGELDLTFRLALLMNQWSQRGATACRLVFRGEIASKDVRLLTSAFSAGMLSGILEDVHINNAEALLRDRGVRLSVQTRKDPGSFKSTITVEVDAQGKTYKAAGALFGNDPRLIRLEDYYFEAFLDGNLVIFHHQDRPGIIGRVGTLFGQHNVNITQMSVGPTAGTGASSGEAIGVVQVDDLPEAVTPETVERAMEAVDGIYSARFFRLPPRGQMPKVLNNMRALGNG